MTVSSRQAPSTPIREPASRSGGSQGEAFTLISADGTRVRGWRNQGRSDAIPVVISNGLGTPPAVWPSLAAARDRYRVASWYYRGTAGGERPQDPRRITIDDHVGDLLSVMDAERMERAVVCCWSLGVNIAFEAALRHPDRVAGLMAVAGVPGGTFRAMFGPLGVPRPLRHHAGVAVARMMRTASPVLNAVVPRLPLGPTATVLRHSGLLSPWTKSDALQAALAEFVQHDWGWYFDLALAAADHAPLDLSGVRVPVTLVAGSWDILTSSRDMVEAAAQLPHAEIRVLPGSHFLPAEYPDELVDLLGELVRRTDLAAGGRRRRAHVSSRPDYEKVVRRSRRHTLTESQWADSASA